MQFITPVAIAATLILMFLLIIPVIISPGPAMIDLGVALTAIPVYLIFVMERPYKIRPKFIERLSGMYVYLSYVLCMSFDSISGIYLRGMSGMYVYLRG